MWFNYENNLINNLNKDRYIYPFDVIVIIVEKEHRVIGNPGP